MPAAVNRRCDQRIGISLNFRGQIGVLVSRIGGEAGVIIGEIQKSCQFLLEDMRIRLIPIFPLGDFLFSLAAERCKQRAAEFQYAFEIRILNAADIGTGILYIHIASADAAIRRFRLEQAHQILKITLRAPASRCES